MNRPHEGLRKSESQWPIHQINWQRTRYVYDLYYKYKRISRELYDYCTRNKIIDAPLAAKWKKKGFDRLCSVHAINTRNTNFGTTSICRVPRMHLRKGQLVEDRLTGCRGCASGPGGFNNIFGNNYGQYLAAVQVAREEASKLTNEEYVHSKEKVFAANHEEVEDAKKSSEKVATQAKKDFKKEADASEDWLTSKKKNKAKRKAPEDGAQGEEKRSKS